MVPAITNPRDFWAGLIYITFGLGTVFFAREYPIGSLQRMGPGYFPIALAGLLVLFGAASIIRSFSTAGPRLVTAGWRPLLYVIGATVLFALLLPRAGLVIALFELALISAAASRYFKWSPRASMALFGLVAFCSIVFVTLLQVPMPIRGSWFD